MKKLVSLLFHRAILVIFALVVQLILLLIFILKFNEYFVYFYWIGFSLSVIVVLWIVGNKSNPAYKIAWIIPILIFPFFGGVIYLIFGGNHLSNRTQKKMKGMAHQMRKMLEPDFKAEELRPFGADAVNQARYLEQIACCPAYANTATEYFPLGDLCFPEMLKELKKARRYIFLEYFIIAEGKMWGAILEVLKEKAAAGVDVRVIYDDVGCMFTLPRDYADKLEEAGIKCSVFNPFVPILSTRLNNRSHRKLCIIDGRTGFTGGINLADEYINAKERFGHWKDSSILLRGDAVWSMTVMFLTMWEYVRGTQDDYELFRPVQLPKELTQGGGYVQPYTDNPLDNEAVGENVYLNLITKAERYVYLMTPYLIIDDTMNTALCNAAKSGVDVRIITPSIPDKATVFELTRAHYEPLLEAGVQIYEYTPGFVHAKNFAVDDRYGIVGSINMDYRSLFLHFENGVWLCGTPAVAQIKGDFLATLGDCRPVTLTQMIQLPMPHRIFRSILRVFAPLM